MALHIDAVNAFESLQAFVQAAVNHAGFSKSQYERSVLTAISGFQGCEQFAKTALALESECSEARLHSPIANKLGTDPFSLPITLHRRFQGLDENAYSDWLAWVLQVLCKEKAVADPIKLCERLFGGELNTEVFNDYEEPDIQRETPIQHDEKSRRTDLLVSFMKKGLLWHVEVKATSAEAGNLEAHEDYVKILRDKYFSGFDERNIRHILLVTNSVHKSYPSGNVNYDFKALLWADLCQRLRQIVLDTDMPILSASIAMLFCGLVEQQLLGIQRDSIAQLKHLLQRS